MSGVEEIKAGHSVPSPELRYLSTAATGRLPSSGPSGASPPQAQPEPISQTKNENLRSTSSKQYHYEREATVHRRTPPAHRSRDRQRRQPMHGDTSSTEASSNLSGEQEEDDDDDDMYSSDPRDGLGDNYRQRTPSHRSSAKKYRRPSTSASRVSDASRISSKSSPPRSHPRQRSQLAKTSSTPAARRSRTPNASSKTATTTTASPLLETATTTTASPLLEIISAALTTSLQLLLTPLRLVLSTVLSSLFSSVILPLVVTGLVLALVVQTMRAAGLGAVASLLSTTATAPLSLATAAWCGTIGGPGCGRRNVTSLNQFSSSTSSSWWSWSARTAQRTAQRVQRELELAQAREKEREQLSNAARLAGTKATQARDIYQAMLSLGDGSSNGGPGGADLGLHPVEVWELATAVRYSSSLDGREFLASQLGELGDSIRDVKDDVISLNSLAHNSMAWVVYEFERLELVIAASAEAQSLLLEESAVGTDNDRSTSSSARDQLQDRNGPKIRNGAKLQKMTHSGSSASSSSSTTGGTRALSYEELSVLLDSVFNKLNDALGSLLTALERTLPRATRASDHARLIYGALHEAEADATGTLALGAIPGASGNGVTPPRWADWLVDRAAVPLGFGSESSWKRKQLQRDIRLAKDSAIAVDRIWRGLEQTRAALVGYRENVGHYKAGVIGFQLSGVTLSVDDEVRALRGVMSNFRDTLDEAKGTSKRNAHVGTTGQRALDQDHAER